MPFNLARARVLLLELPRTGKLAYCLMRDGRVPLARKVAAGTALALIVSPVDVPAWIPVVGDMDALALAILAVKVFVDACPEEVVEQHRAAIRDGRSLFDGDLAVALELTQNGVRRLAARWQARGLDAPTRESEDESA